MNIEEIEELIKDLTLAYASGENGENGWLIVGRANKEKAELIVRQHFEKSKGKEIIEKYEIEIIKLKAELSIYKEIISKSNFSPTLLTDKNL